MNDKLLPCPFAKDASEKIISSLRRNTFFAYAWKRADKETEKEYFEGVVADIITAAWNRRADPFIVIPITENAPLTLNELQGMEGEPVYIVFLMDQEKSEWKLLDGQASKCTLFRSDYSLYNDSYGETWLAYRRKPEEENT